MEHAIKTLQYRLELYKTASKYSPSPYWGELINEYEEAVKVLTEHKYIQCDWSFNLDMSSPPKCKDDFFNNSCTYKILTNTGEVFDMNDNKVGVFKDGKIIFEGNEIIPERTINVIMP